MNTATADIIPIASDLCGSIEGKRPPLVEPGEYAFVLCKRWMGHLYGRKAAKLLLIFKVVTEGSACGKRLYKCYNVRSINKRRGTFSVGWNSAFIKDYAHLFGLPRNLKSLGTNRLRNKIIKGKVRTVKSDFQQRPLPECLHYSVISELTEVIVGEM